jgi:enamine deaminase RidA (YjgF/YER057c/UK114 family)
VKARRPPIPITLLFCLSVAIGGALGEAEPAPLLRVIEPSPTAGHAGAVVVGGVALAHTGQQFPISNGKLVGANDVAKQTEQVLDNLALTLREAGSGLDRAVRLHAYLTDARQIAAVQKVLAQRFAGPHQPALSLVESALPVPGALVAMDVVAATSHSPPAGAVNLLRAGQLGGSARAAHVSVLPVGRVVFVSGQAEKGTLTEATVKTLQGLEATLHYLKLTRAQIAQIKCFLQPMSDIASVERGLQTFFAGGPVPPVVFVEWTSTAPIEIELIAAGGQALADESAMEFITPPQFKASPVYAKVVRVNHGGLVYTSGLYGPAFGDATTQVREAFVKLRKLVTAAGGDMKHLAKATYYVTSNDTSAKLNELRPDYYDPQRPPAASKATVRGVGLDGCRLMLDMIGVVGSNR